MCPMIDEYHTPFMYRDAAAGAMGLPFEFDPTLMGMGSMGAMGAMGPMGGFYNTNYLGGVTLKPKLNQDTVQIIKNKDKENNDSLKKFGLVMLTLFGLGVVRCMFKGKNSWFSGLLNKFKSSTSTSTTTTTATGRVWYNPLTWFKKGSSTPTPTPTPSPATP